MRYLACSTALREPIVTLAARHDTLVAGTARRVLWRTGGAWSDAGANAPTVGQLAAVFAERGAGGLWAAGSAGIAFLDPRAGTWASWNSPADVAPPVRDIAATDRWVWLATPLGLVRLDRRALVR